MQTGFHDLTVNWSHTKHLCFSGPTTNLPHWTYLHIQPKLHSISTATHFYLPRYRDKIIYLTNSLRLWVKKICKIEVHLIKSSVPISQDANIPRQLQFLLWCISPSQCANHKLLLELFFFESFAKINILNSIKWNNNLHDSICNNICCSSLKIGCVRSKLSSPREWIALYCFISISHTVWCLVPCHTFHSHVLLALLWHLPAEKILSYKATFSTWFFVVYI